MHSANCTEDRSFARCCSWIVVDMPWCANDRAVVQAVQKTVVPQVQYSDRVVDVAVHRPGWTSL